MLFVCVSVTTKSAMALFCVFLGDGQSSVTTRTDIGEAQKTKFTILTGLEKGSPLVTQGHMESSVT